MSQMMLTIEQAMALSKKPPRKTKAEHLAKMLAMPPAPALTEAERLAQRSLFERHDVVTYTFRLPMPPTTNHVKAIFQPPRGRARLITTAEGRAYFEAVKELWGRSDYSWSPPLTGRLRLLLAFWFRDRRKADVSNRIKVLEDALTYAGVWGDDSQIDAGGQLRGGVDPAGIGYVDVIVETICQP